MGLLAYAAAFAAAAWTAFVLFVAALSGTGARMAETPAAPPPAPRAEAPVQAAAAVEPAAAEEDDYQGLPPGTGRDEVLGLCGACHSMKLVTQQGLSRSTWSEVLVFMVEEQEMTELEPDDEKLVLDYLEKFYGPDRLALKMKRGAGAAPPAGD